MDNPVLDKVWSVVRRGAQRARGATGLITLDVDKPGSMAMSLARNAQRRPNDIGMKFEGRRWS